VPSESQISAQTSRGARGKGRREKQHFVVTKVMCEVHICRSPPKKALTCFVLIFLIFLSRVWAFRNKGSSKTQKRKTKVPKKSISGHHKKCGFCPLRSFFLPRLFCSCFFPSRVWAFRKKGEIKNATKKNTENVPQLPKKALIYFLIFFPSMAPLKGR
jgi:hypothetical protein